jgi:hypothetical protein
VLDILSPRLPVAWIRGKTRHQQARLEPEHGFVGLVNDLGYFQTTPKTLNNRCPYAFFDFTKACHFFAGFQGLREVSDVCFGGVVQ